MDLFFEIQRHRTHIFCDAKETCTVAELKRVVEGILKVPVEEQVLKRKEAADKPWLALDDAKTLQECGFSTNNARAQQPAVVALCLRQGSHAEEDVRIEALSTPPPLPDVMRSNADPSVEPSGTPASKSVDNTGA